MDTPLRNAFSRIGGKSKLADRLISMMPPHKTYVEAFIGGGAVYLKKPLAENNIINDLDNDIIDLWRDLKAIEKFDFEFDASNVNKETFLRLLNEERKEDIQDRFFRNLYLSKISFGAKRKTYGYSTDEKRKFYKHKYIKKNLQHYQFKLNKTEILNEDYKSVIDKYDNEDTLFYLDPPYSKQKKLWEYAGNIDEKEFVKILRQMKGKFILSYDDTKDNRILFKDFHLYTVPTVYAYQTSKEKRKRPNELIVTNFVAL